MEQDSAGRAGSADGAATTAAGHVLQLATTPCPSAASHSSRSGAWPCSSSTPCAGSTAVGAASGSRWCPGRRASRPRRTRTPGFSRAGRRSWRDSGITWLALAGLDVAKIQRRAGHDHITTTIGYVKAAEDITGTIGQPFPPLPASLVEPDESDRAIRADWANEWAKRRGGRRKANLVVALPVRRAGLEPACQLRR